MRQAIYESVKGTHSRPRSPALQGFFHPCSKVRTQRIIAARSVKRIEGMRFGFAAIGAETEEESLGGGVASVPCCLNRASENLLSVC